MRRIVRAAALLAVLAAGKAAQLGCVAVGADRQGCGHGGISEDNAAATPQASD